MRSSLSMLLASGLLLAVAPAFASPRPRHASRDAHATVRHAVLTHAFTSRSASSRTGLKHVSTRSRREEAAPVHREPVRTMEPERATEIQTALIKAGYLQGEPTGTWDAASVAAMQKLQGDNGWQTKITPDARALNKLGLGSTQASASSRPALPPDSPQ